MAHSIRAISGEKAGDGPRGGGRNPEIKEDQDPGWGGQGPRERRTWTSRGGQRPTEEETKPETEEGGRGLEKEGTDTIERSGTENRTEEEDSLE